MDTPMMSQHARERCAEMGISTKVAKRIVQNPSLTRDGGPHGRHLRLIRSTLYPEYTVLYDPSWHGVVTVLFQTECDYQRAGDTFIPLPRGAHRG